MDSNLFVVSVDVPKHKQLIPVIFFELSNTNALSAVPEPTVIPEMYPALVLVRLTAPNVRVVADTPFVTDKDPRVPIEVIFG